MKYKGKNNFEMVGDPAVPEWLESLHELEAQNETPNATQLTCHLNFFNCPTIKNNPYIDASKTIVLWSSIGILTGFFSILLGEAIIQNKNFNINDNQFSLYKGILGGGLSYLIFEFLNQMTKIYNASQPPILSKPLDLRELLLKGLLLTNMGIVLANLIIDAGVFEENIQNDLIATTVGTAVIHGSIGLLNSLR